jgi:hypothetical protein
MNLEELAQPAPPGLKPKRLKIKKVSEVEFPTIAIPKHRNPLPQLGRREKASSPWLMLIMSSNASLFQKSMQERPINCPGDEKKSKYSKG